MPFLNGVFQGNGAISMDLDGNQYNKDCSNYTMLKGCFNVNI